LSSAPRSDPPAAVHVVPLRRGERVERLLADFCGVAEGELALANDPLGMPRLLRPESGVRFSISHAGDLTVVALARSLDVGVDIERVDRDVSGWVLWPHVLSAAEAAGLASFADSPFEQQKFLLTTWVAKEALLKAAGVGLAIEPREITLGEQGRVRTLPAVLGPAAEWNVTWFSLDRHIGAVACRATRVDVYVDGVPRTHSGMTPGRLGGAPESPTPGGLRSGRRSASAHPERRPESSRGWRATRGR
jgi:phosphopantetheinyl transferase